MVRLSPSYRAAKDYAAQGYSVLPLAPGEKRPHPRLVPHGLKEASRDPATLEAWWRSCPQAGAGILPGPEVLVLDFDDPEAWERLKEEHPTSWRPPGPGPHAGGCTSTCAFPRRRWGGFPPA